VGWFSRKDKKQFGTSKSETLPQFYRQYSYLTDCWDECPKNRIIRAPDGEPGLNYFCRGFKKFFTHATPEVAHIVAWIKPIPFRRGGACEPCHG
jgi:uncharacterized protein